MSSLEVPNSMAATASAIKSPARGPRTCTPRMRSVCRSARTLTPALGLTQGQGTAVLRGRERGLGDIDAGGFQLFFRLADAGAIRNGTSR